MPQVEFTMTDGSVKYSPELGEDPTPDLVDEIADGRRAWFQLENEEWVNLAHVTTFAVYRTPPP